jgi:hypothetical protein
VRYGVIYFLRPDFNQQVKADRYANGGKVTTGEKKQINGEQKESIFGPAEIG